MVEQALDALFVGPVETFIAERDRLAKELKAAGDKDGAAVVKAQHKPTVVAHALNVLVRTQRPLVDELLDVGRAMASGQGDFQEAMKKQRALVQTLTQKAGSDGPAIVAVLQGAMASAELAEQVLKARFSKLPEVPVGFFGQPGAAAPAPAVAPASKPSLKLVAPPPRDTKHEAAVAAAEKAAEKAKAEAEEKGRESDALEKAAREASNAAAAAKHAHVQAVQRAKELADELRKLRLKG